MVATEPATVEAEPALAAAAAPPIPFHAFPIESEPPGAGWRQCNWTACRKLLKRNNIVLGAAVLDSALRACAVAGPSRLVPDRKMCDTESGGWCAKKMTHATYGRQLEADPLALSQHA